MSHATSQPNRSSSKIRLPTARVTKLIGNAARVGCGAPGASEDDMDGGAPLMAAPLPLCSAAPSQRLQHLHRGRPDVRRGR